MSDGTCSEDDCTKPALARGWCGTHYARWRRAQMPKGPARTSALDRGDADKTCSACQLSKPIGEFYLSRDRSGKIRWVRAECKSCARLRVARDGDLREEREPATSGPACMGPGCENFIGERKSNVGRHPKYCSHKCKERARDKPPMSPEDRARYDRAKTLRKYGLTEADWDALLAAQEGRCAICRGETPGGKGRWHIDHCHSTGKVRGLLCHHCNVGLGHFKDDPGLLMTAIAYLKAVV